MRLFISKPQPSTTQTQADIHGCKHSPTPFQSTQLPAGSATGSFTFTRWFTANNAKHAAPSHFVRSASYHSSNRTSLEYRLAAQSSIWRQAMQQGLNLVDVVDSNKGVLSLITVPQRNGTVCFMDIESQAEPMDTAKDPAADKRSPRDTSVLDDKSGIFLLPDELVSQCLSSLTAEDLCRLEKVSRRLRELVLSDPHAWRNVVYSRWPATHGNACIFENASIVAGGWKNLYVEKHKTDKKNVPWIVPCKSEIEAIVEVIKGGDCGPAKMYSSSPTSVTNMNWVSAVQNVVFLVDGSSSVTEADFTAMKDFCRSMVVSLRQTHPESQAAVVQFNQYPKIECGLEPIGAGTKVLDVLDSLEQMMGSTDLRAPMRKAYELLLPEAHGEKVVIFLTDGQTHAEELRLTEQEAQRICGELGARIFTMGVGRDVDESGLIRVAGSDCAILRSFSSSKGGYFTLRKMAKR